MIDIKKAHKDFVAHLNSEGRSPSTVLAYGKDIEQLTYFLLREGLNDVREVELSHLEKFMKKLADTNYTNKSISRKTNSTKTFFRYLYEKKHIEKDIAVDLKHPKVNLKAPRILSKMEYRALRDATRDDVRTYAMVEVLLQTGVTISELAEMEMKHLTIGENSGNLFVPAKNNKTARNIPLNKAVIDSLKNYFEKERNKNTQKIDEGFVFVTKTGNQLLVRNIRSAIDRYFKLAGIENVKVNDLRHTFMAHHLMNGINLLHLSKIAGHKRVSTTERYLEFIKVEEKQEKTELAVL